jgi:hypothetical protein
MRFGLSADSNQPQLTIKSDGLWSICLPIDHVTNEALESFILDELLVNVGVVFQECITSFKA